jgi:hypothetical protein
MSAPQQSSASSQPQTITVSQFQQLLTQFAQFKTQFNDQQQLNQTLQDQVDQLTTNSSLQNNTLLSQYETQLEEYVYQIEKSTDDSFSQHQLDMLQLICVRINHVDYRGPALRDLFQLRRGVVPATISALTVGHLIKWLQKRLKGTIANTSQFSYYHTLLKATHFDHPIMQHIDLNNIPLNSTYFPTNLHLWAPLPPTPIEYHRLLIAIAYDLDYCESGILPLITHFGFPVKFPQFVLNTNISDNINPIATIMASTSPAISPRNNTKDILHSHNSSKTQTTSTTSALSIPASPTATTTTATNTATPTTPTTLDPFFYLSYSTHIPCLLYAPLWFGVLSRDSFRPLILEKTQINSNSFIQSRWFSSLCRFGYIFDQITRIITKFPLEGLYPSHQAYCGILPRFFSSHEWALTDPLTFPSFGHKGFPMLYSFVLFIASHLAITHSALEAKNTIKEHPTSSSSSSSSSSSTSSSSTTPTPTPTSSTTTPITPSTITSTIPKSQPTPTNKIDNHNKDVFKKDTVEDITYPVIRDLYNAAIKGSLDCFSLGLILKSTDLFNHLTPNERNKTNFSRLFGIFHFKVLSGASIPAWLSKPLLGIGHGTWKYGSVFEPLCSLPQVEHLARYFDKSYANCCDKRAALAAAATGTEKR